MQHTLSIFALLIAQLLQYLLNIFLLVLILVGTDTTGTDTDTGTNSGPVTDAGSDAVVSYNYTDNSECLCWSVKIF